MSSALIRAVAAARDAFQSRHKAAVVGEDDDREIVARIIDRGQERLADLAAALLGDDIIRTEFIDRAETILRSTYQAGAALGGAARTEATRIADALLEAREDYLDGFADDLTRREDDGGLSLALAAARAALWAGGAFAAFQMARGARAQREDGATHAWFELSGGSHCDDCIERAAGNPYPIDDMPGWPGDGSTQCSGNDRCGVRFGTLTDGDNGE